MVLILSGPVHGGKTTFLELSLPRWAARGVRPCGFLSVPAADGQGRKCYDLLEVRTGRRLPYLRREGETGAERAGPFSFVPGTLELARALIRGAKPDEILVVDEAGPLELRGGGLWPELRKVLADPARRSLVVVREEILEDFAAALAPAVPLVLDVRDPNAGKLMDGYLFGTVTPDADQG